MINIPDSFFPVNQQGLKICPKCKNPIEKCGCPSFDPNKPKNVCAEIRLDKSGRRGKIVTVIDKLPKDDKFLKDLAKKLKAGCASGGTYFSKNEWGIIEIQGDKQDAVKKLLKKENIVVK